MQYIIFGYNEKDEIFDNKPLLTAIGSTNIDGIILAETFLEMTKNEFIDDKKLLHEINKDLLKLIWER